MAYSTGNPVEPNGSADPRDLSDNAQIVDKLVNSSDISWLGRLSKTLKTWAGMTAEHEAAQAQRVVEFQQFLRSSGYEVPVPYSSGINITRSTQTVLYNGEIYRPKPDSIPFVTTTFSADSAKWVSNGDNSLRQALAALTGAGKVGFDDSVAYPEDTVGFELARLSSPGSKRQQKTYADFDMLSNLGNLETLNTAILSGTVRIAFCGDSITEGDRDQVYDNSVAAIIMRTLRAQNPTITFVFANFSLAGRGIATYFDSNYKGIAGPNDDPATGFYRPPGNALTSQWPGGSVVGKSWADHTKDFAPDLVVILFGANDLSGLGPLGAAQYKSALDYQNTWPKVPSTAIATAALPAVSAGYQEQVQISADTARGVARERGHTLLDINRTFVLYRQAVDVDNMAYTRDDSFKGFPTGWTQSVGSTLARIDADGFAINGSGSCMRNLESQDLNIEANFSMPNWTTQTANLIYRSLGTLDKQYTAQITSGSVFLYWGSTIIGAASIASIPNNSQVNLHVDARGAKHRVYVNGILVATVWDYGNLRKGTYGILITGGAGTASALVAHTGNPYAVGLPELTDVDMYGTGDFSTNPLSLGGNAINHPTKLASTVVWAASFAPLMHHIRSLPSYKTVSVIAPFRASGAEVFDVPGTTLQTSIDGALVGTATGVLATSTGATANKHDCRLVTGGRTVVVQVFHSPGANFLSVGVALGAGTWLLTASAQFTKDSAGVYRNAMTVTGVRAS